ncbi:hypothetical protein [Tunicatimonas pelagia]|uniref:hypothetical protein n=1 Tax=Tunicatimonas pelagia TaxID=931531 RepID=UPI002666761D|nr:hypothetical protein [Tunicatimonas pelagia]WKN43948.1 hypothetical protein P0M28_03050 [Tunicatimonas pelagia]
MKLAYLIITLIFLFGSCSSWKEVMVADGNQNDAIQNAIYDFLHSDKLSKKDSVFYIYTKDINPEVLGVNIFGTYDKVLVSTEDSVTFSYSGFPTGHFESKEKLFYWHDSTKTVSNDLISTLTKYNLIDTMVVNAYIPESTIDHSRKGVDYYFCKNNLLKYKKVRTREAMGYYDPPALNCEQ